MKYFKELSGDPNIQSYFDNLIGLTIEEARKKLGFWWTCACGKWPIFRFERSAGAYVELRTNEKNVVTSEHHNSMALHYVKIDIYEYNQ